jgi:hypothetical protein
MVSASVKKAVKKSWSGKKYVINQTRVIIASVESRSFTTSNSILCHTISRTQQESITPGDDGQKWTAGFRTIGRVLCFAVERELGAQSFRGNTE